MVLKDIKNVHLSVYPPTGRVRIAAPLRMSLDTIRVFAISKLGWIKQQQRNCAPRTARRRASISTARATTSGASATCSASSKATTRAGGRTATQPVGAAGAPAEADAGEQASRQAMVEAWYREQVKKAAVPALIAKWEPLMGVKVERFFVQRMKTRDGRG